MSSLGGQALPTINASGLYSGSAAANRAVPHGLGRVPKFVFITTLVGVAGGSQGVLINGIVSCISRDNAAAALNGLTTQIVTAADATNFYVGNAADYQESFNTNGINWYWYAA